MKNTPPANSPGSAPAASSFFLHKSAHDPRAAALSALSRVLAGEADAQEALDKALQSPSMMPTDKGLCTELLYGHLRMHLRLQWFSTRYLKKPEKLPWEMRLCLEQALYSLAFLRVPARAAVHWAVEHVRNRFGQGLAKVANAVLRSMQRELSSFRDYAFYKNACPSEEEARACWHAMPLWIVRLWDKAYGREKSEVLLRISGQSAPQGLRLNKAFSGWERLRTEFLGKTREGSSPARPVGSCGLLFENSLPYEAKQLVPAGRASGQSCASYAALEYFNPSEWPRPIWDCCAGRGGKTLALLEQGIAVALASDTSTRRLSALPQEYARLGLTSPPCPAILCGSAAEAAQGFFGFKTLDAGELSAPAEEKPTDMFGAILIDAPCSGLGTLSRHPEIRLRRSEQDCSTLVALQKDILHAAWERLLPGGRLIYLTCTANPEENELQVRAFIQGHSDALLLDEYAAGDIETYREFFYGAMLQKVTR